MNIMRTSWEQREAYLQLDWTCRFSNVKAILQLKNHLILDRTVAILK